MATNKRAVSVKKASPQKESKSTTTAAKKGSPPAKSRSASASSKKPLTSKTSSKPTEAKSASRSKPPSPTSKRQGIATAKNKGIIASVVDKVSHIFSSTPSDAIVLLKADHKKVSALFEKVKANEDGNNAATFGKIKTELETHTHIEEKIFYPYLLEKGGKELKDLTREALEEHAQAKQLLHDLAAIDADTAEFTSKLKVLMEDIEHHVKEEEDEMFPAVEKKFSSEVLTTLGKKLEAEKARFKGDSNASPYGKALSAR